MFQCSVVAALDNLKKVVIVITIFFIIYITWQVVDSTKVRSNPSPFRVGELVPVIARNLTCYNNTYTRHDGIINDSCYFFGCRAQCDSYMGSCMQEYYKFERCAYEFTECLKQCVNDIQPGSVMYSRGSFDLHDWGCYINETSENITQERCYR